jgi:hypothetical protein
MSSAFHAVHRSDNLIGFGNRPDFTPAHQHVLPSGITVKIWANRKNPVSGIVCIPTSLVTLSSIITNPFAPQ